MDDTNNETKDTTAPITKRSRSLAKTREGGLSFPGVVLHAVGLEMPEGLPEVQADRILEDIGKAHLSLGWAVADALVFCERFGQASKYARASELTGLSVDTLRTYAWVARHVPLSIRIDSLSISHHRLVANKTPEVQSRYLLQASEQGLSVAALGQVIEADSKPAHTTLEEASRVLPEAAVLPSASLAEELADTLAQKLEEADAKFLFNTAQSIIEPKQEEPEQEASEVLGVERVLDIERVTEDDPGGVVFGSRSQHFDYSQPNLKNTQPNRLHDPLKSRGVPALAPGAPTLLPAKPAEATHKPAEVPKVTEIPNKVTETGTKATESTVKLGSTPTPTPRSKFVPNATDEIAEGVLRLGPVWFYRFEISVNGKLTHINVMVSPHDTGNGLRWQATTDNGRGDVNTIPRTPLFTPHASREELEVRLLAHFGKEASK